MDSTTPIADAVAKIDSKIQAPKGKALPAPANEPSEISYDAAFDTYSQQPHQVYLIVMHPDNADLTEYLEKDGVYYWRY